MLSIELEGFAQMHTLVRTAVFKIQTTSFTQSPSCPFAANCLPHPRLPATTGLISDPRVPECRNGIVGRHSFLSVSFTGQNALWSSVDQYFVFFSPGDSWMKQSIPSPAQGPVDSNAWLLGDLHIHRYLVLEYLNLSTSRKSDICRLRHWGPMSFNFRPFFRISFSKF